MPRISIDNYDTVASWNGSQDLFVVEQPDGTKVATPAMVKQFMEAGDFTATGEVKDGHGNVLKDMAKASVVDAKIGDLSQTGLTGNSVAEQLDTAREQIAGLTANILTGIDISAYNSASNQYTAPTDGYVRMELRNANHYFYLNVNDAVMLGGEGHQVTNAYDYISVFIKKGMKLYYTGTVQTAVFYSLVNG